MDLANPEVPEDMSIGFTGHQKSTYVKPGAIKLLVAWMPHDIFRR